MIEKTILVKYILSAMVAWVPLGNHAFVESRTVTEARYQSIASDIVEVALDPKEPSVLTSVELAGNDVAVGTALLLANIGSLEGGFQAFVDDGTCNRPDFKPNGQGDCDHGIAWSIWGLHTMGGIQLTETEFLGRFYATDLTHLINGPDLIRDRKVAARVALHMARYSINRTRTLCLYTNERVAGTSTCLPSHPLADERKNRAVTFMAQNKLPQPTV